MPRLGNGREEGRGAAGKLEASGERARHLRRRRVNGKWKREVVREGVGGGEGRSHAWQNNTAADRQRWRERGGTDIEGDAGCHG